MFENDLLFAITCDAPKRHCHKICNIFCLYDCRILKIFFLLYSNISRSKPTTIY